MTALRVLLAVLLSSSLATAGEEFLVTGRVEYEDKAWNEGGWTGVDPWLPVRHADVSVWDLDRNARLGSGRTDEQGEFAIVAKTSKPVTRLAARVDAETRHRAKAEKAFPRLKVRGLTGEVYAAWTAEVHDPPPGQAVDLGTTSIPKVLAGSREGSPFNVLDMGVAAFEFLTGPAAGVDKRAGTLTLQWPNVTGSYAKGRKAWIGSPDGYDDAVILHEIGHLVHNVYSDSDNPGGAHYFGDSDQDPRLSFGEGWATAFAGLVLEHLGQPAWYVDANGSTQYASLQLALDLESSAPYYDAALGAADEVAVACVLFDVLDDDAPAGPGDAPGDDAFAPQASAAGLQPWSAWWDVFTGPVKTSKRSSLNDCWDGWLREHGDGPALDPLALVFDARSIVFENDVFEPNETRKTARAIELSHAGEWIDDLTLYSREPGSTKRGVRDRDWFSVELQAGWRVDVETRYPGGVFDATTQADTWLMLRSPSGKLRGKAEWGGQGRNAALRDVYVDESGAWTLLVRTRNNVHRYGRYELRVQRVD